MRLHKDDRGNVILEFALVFPIFIALVLGTINFAILLNNHIVAASAARDAGRTAAVTGRLSDALSKGQKILEAAGLGQGRGDVRVSGLGSRSERVTATVTYRTPVFAPGIAAFLGGKAMDSEITLEQQSSYYVEYRNRTEPDRTRPVCVGCSCSGECW